MWQWLIFYTCAGGARAVQGWDKMERKAKPTGILPSSNLQKTATRTTLIDNFLCSPKTRPLVVSCLNAQQGWLKLGIKKSNLTCRLARNWTDNLSSLQDLPQWSSVRTSDEQPRWTRLGYSVLSQSWWGLLRSFLALCLWVYQLTTLKRTKGSFFCPAVAIKATREKKIEESFLPLPNLHVLQLRSSQPSE